MAAPMTLREIEALVNTYTHLEQQHQNASVDELQEIKTIRETIEHYRSGQLPVDPKLRDCARILAHFCDETFKKRASTAQQFVRAMCHHRRGLDARRSIKRSRLH